jgi:hypothetical protein
LSIKLLKISMPCSLAQGQECSVMMSKPSTQMESCKESKITYRVNEGMRISIQGKTCFTFKGVHFADGRAVTQAVSHRFPTAEARIRARVKSCGICGGQSDTGAGFLPVLQFPLPSILLTAPRSSSSVAGTIGQWGPQ